MTLFVSDALRRASPSGTETMARPLFFRSFLALFFTPGAYCLLCSYGDEGILFSLKTVAAFRRRRATRRKLTRVAIRVEFLRAHSRARHPSNDIYEIEMALSLTHRAPEMIAMIETIFSQTMPSESANHSRQVARGTARLENLPIEPRSRSVR